MNFRIIKTTKAEENDVEYAVYIPQFITGKMEFWYSSGNFKNYNDAMLQILAWKTMVKFLEKRFIEQEIVYEEIYISK